MTTTPPDPLHAAIGRQAHDVAELADAIATGAVLHAEDLSVIDKAAALVELDAVRIRLDALLDRVNGAAELLPIGGE